MDLWTFLKCKGSQPNRNDYKGERKIQQRPNNRHHSAAEFTFFK